MTFLLFLLLTWPITSFESFGTKSYYTTNQTPKLITKKLTSPFLIPILLILPNLLRPRQRLPNHPQQPNRLHLPFALRQQHHMAPPPPNRALPPFPQILFRDLRLLLPRVLDELGALVGPGALLEGDEEEVAVRGEGGGEGGGGGGDWEEEATWWLIMAPPFIWSGEEEEEGWDTAAATAWNAEDIFFCVVRFFLALHPPVFVVESSVIVSLSEVDGSVSSGESSFSLLAAFSKLPVISFADAPLSLVALIIVAVHAGTYEARGLPCSPPTTIVRFTIPG
ncbi:hypothetical protein EDD18DRAFT_1342223 [Armillaria luteobubalina]|uniref:Uncharacterized protein n=1 Tax=Armillaria luteobubalina TaxID=153913 RepID=A0AA39U1H1_9AGAR|nr:hypothetical protein EDD18DRAFT_1342223 [Armillaria luteobubalina]